MFEILTRKSNQILNGSKFRKEIIRFGKFRHPNPQFRTKKNEWVFGSKEADQLIANFDAGIVDSVKLLGDHDEDHGKKLGAVVSLKKTDTGVEAIIEIEDEATIKDVETLGGDGKTLAHGVSVGIESDFPLADTDDKEVAEGFVLRHVALATIPWISGMKDWETVEETALAASKGYFGNKDYTGVPLVPENEWEEDGDGMTPQQKKALQLLAKKTGKSVEELMSALGIEEKEKEDKDKDKNSVLAALESIANGLNESSDDDDDDDDDDDKDKGKDKGKNKDNDVANMQKEFTALKDSTKGITDIVKTLVDNLDNAQKGVDEQRKLSNQNAAETAVKELVTAGRVLPKDRDHWQELHLSNVELFESLSKALPVQIDYANEPEKVDPFESNPFSGKLTNEQAEEESKRYLKMATPLPAGNQDKVDGRVDK